MTRTYKLRKDQFYSFILLSIIYLETAFGNTPLQNYNLTINRIFLLVELFILFISFSDTKIVKRRAILFITIALIFIASYVFINSTFLLEMFMTAIAVYKIGESRSFEILYKYKLFFLVVIILFSVVGIIPNAYMAVEKGVGTRYGYTLGFTHPNRLASYVMSIILCYICWKNEKLKSKNVLLILTLTILFYFITKSRTLLFGILIFALFFSFYKCKFTTNITKKLITIISVISLPVCVTISIVFPLLLLSSTGMVQKAVYFINLMFSRRFTNIEHMFLAYPVTFTGGTFDTSQMDRLFEYSVVDNGYIRFLYQYGILGFLLFCAISFLSVTTIIKKKEYIWLIACIIISILGLLENIYVDIGLNTFVIFWAGILNANRGKDYL